MTSKLSNHDDTEWPSLADHFNRIMHSKVFTGTRALSLFARVWTTPGTSQIQLVRSCKTYHFWFRSTRITESPRINILLRKRSLLMVLAFLHPFPVFGISVHSSFTFSRTMLQCLSKAFTRPRSFRLFRQLISTCALVFTLWLNTDKGPAWKSWPSFFCTWEENLSGVRPTRNCLSRSAFAEAG